MSLLLAFIIAGVMVKSGIFAEISSEFQLLSVCVLFCGGLAGMGGGRHD